MTPGSDTSFKREPNLASLQTYCYDDPELFLLQIFHTFRQEIITDNVDKPSCRTVLPCQDNVNVLWVHRRKPFDESLQLPTKQKK